MENIDNSYIIGVLSLISLILVSIIGFYFKRIDSSIVKLIENQEKINVDLAKVKAELNNLEKNVDKDYSRLYSDVQEIKKAIQAYFKKLETIESKLT